MISKTCKISKNSSSRIKNIALGKIQINMPKYNTIDLHGQN